MLAGVLRSNHHQMFRTGMCFAHLFSPRAAGLPKVELRPIQLVIGLREFAAPPRQGACHSRGSWAGAWPGQRRSTWSSCRRPATSEAVPPALFSAVPAAQVPCVPAEVQPGQVHVWWMHPHSHAAAALPAQSQLHARCAALLSPEELAECSTGGSAEARLGRLLVRCFLRSVLARYVAPTGNGGARPASAAALQFVRNAHGKPELASPCTTPSGHRLRFNLTHTGGLVGMAVGAERLVGLDAEWLQRRTQGNVMKLARRRLSQQEVEALEGEKHEGRCPWQWKVLETQQLCFARRSPPGHLPEPVPSPYVDARAFAALIHVMNYAYPIACSHPL